MNSVLALLSFQTWAVMCFCEWEKVKEGVESRRWHNNDDNVYHDNADYYTPGNVLILFTSIITFNLCNNPIRRYYLICCIAEISKVKTETFPSGRAWAWFRPSESKAHNQVCNVWCGHFGKNIEKYYIYAFFGLQASFMVEDLPKIYVLMY